MLLIYDSGVKEEFFEWIYSKKSGVEGIFLYITVNMVGPITSDKTQGLSPIGTLGFL